MSFLLSFILLAGCVASEKDYQIQTTPVTVKVQNQDGMPLSGVGVEMRPEKDIIQNPRNPDKPIGYIPEVKFTGEEGQVKKELITNEKYVIHVYAEKTIEKPLQVPDRPVTVEITVDGGENVGVKGKKNHFEDRSDSN